MRPTVTLAEFASGLGNVARVDVLSFHQMGHYKREALGLPYSLNDVTAPSQGALWNAVATFRARGLTAH